MKKSLSKSRIAVLSILILCIFLSGADIFRRQYQNNKIDWKKNIFADGAGYYVYLPWLFIYGGDVTKFPENIEKQTGNGFQIIDNHLKIKYTCGLAIMQMPVFLMVHGVEIIRSDRTDGFSGWYQFVPAISALIYLLLGQILLFRFIRNYCSCNASLLTIIIIFMGSNLYYYACEFPAMSHAYSFALFSAFLYFSDQFHRRNSNVLFAIVAFCAFLIVLIRPTNVLILFIFFAIPSLRNTSINFKHSLNFIRLIILCIVGIIIFAPQLIYWYYLSGNWMYYSYGNESFSNLFSPNVKLFLFSPNNGVFPYSPLWLILLPSALYLAYNKHKFAVLSILLWLAIVYLGSSWYDWRFGCSIGSRTTVEYLALFALPMTVVFDKISNKSFVLKSIIAVVICFSIAANQLIGRKFQKCFMGENDWDWKYYGYLLRPWSHHKTWTNQFKNSTTDEYLGNVEISRSETDNFSKYFILGVEAELGNVPRESEVYLAIVTSGSSNNIHHLSQISGTNTIQKTEITIPSNSSDWQSCKAFVWNKSRTPISIHKLRLIVD